MSYHEKKSAFALTQAWSTQAGSLVKVLVDTAPESALAVYQSDKQVHHSRSYEDLQQCNTFSAI